MFPGPQLRNLQTWVSRVIFAFNPFTQQISVFQIRCTVLHYKIADSPLISWCPSLNELHFISSNLSGSTIYISQILLFLAAEHVTVSNGTKYNNSVSSGCIHMLDWFEHSDHICIVFKLLGLSVYEFMVRISSTACLPVFVGTSFRISFH